MPSRMRILVSVLILGSSVVLVGPGWLPAQQTPAADPGSDGVALGPITPPIFPGDEPAPGSSTVPPDEPYGAEIQSGTQPEQPQPPQQGPAQEPAVEGPVLEGPENDPPDEEPPAEEPSPEEEPSEAEPADQQPGQDQPAEEMPKRSEDQPRLLEPPEATPLAPLAPGLEALRDRMRRVLGYYFNQPFNTRDNSVTDILHVNLAFGCDTEVRRGGPSGDKLNGITCLCWNYPCAGRGGLLLSEGHVAARVGYGLQAHPGQLLAVLALSRVPDSYPVRVGEDVGTVADLVEYEKLHCRAGVDQSHRMLGLAYYLGGDETWENSLGETWSIQRMIAEELDQPVVTGVDGGTHRLLAVSFALDRRAREGLPIDGQFARAMEFITEFQKYALKVQLSDGGWGPHFFASSSAGSDWQARLRSTAHILQWLAFSLPQEDLESPPVAKAFDYLTRLLDSYRQRGNQAYLATPQQIGSLGHGLHALMIYDARVFRARENRQPVEQEAAPVQATSGP